MCFTREIQPMYRNEGSNTVWLRALRLDCTRLTVLSLNVPLHESDFSELNKLLLQTRVEDLTLGPLTSDALSDQSLSVLLSLQSLRSLSVDRPISKDALSLLRQQCGDSHSLRKMRALKFTVESSHEDVIEQLPRIMPRLGVLHINIIKYNADTASWYPKQSLFDAIGGMKRLSHLSLFMDAYHISGEQIWPTVSARNLLALLSCPLDSLLILSYSETWEYPVGFQQTFGSELFEVLHKMQKLSSVLLIMNCEEVLCDVQQQTAICELLADLNLQNFRIRSFTGTEPFDSNVWLGRNSNYYPDPLHWEPRELEHGNEIRGLSYVNEEVTDEDELLVWGDGVLDLGTEDSDDEQPAGDSGDSLVNNIDDTVASDEAKHKTVNESSRLQHHKSLYSKCVP